MIYYLTDEVGTILSIYNYDEAGLKFAREHGKLLAGSFPESEIYLHSGSFTPGNQPKVGYSSSMKGNPERIFSGYSGSQSATGCHTACSCFR